MSAHRDVDRQIQSFLAEGPMELPDASYDEVRDRMEQKRQRALIGPWRTLVSTKMKYGLAGAAMVIVAIIGYQLIGGSNLGGPVTTATAEPSAAPSVAATSIEPSSQPVGDHQLPEGPLLLWDGTSDGVPITVTISGDGWWGRPGKGWFTNVSGSNTHPGTGMIVFGSVEEYYVYGDPCHWRTTLPEAATTAVDELVAALNGQTPGTKDDHEMFGAWTSEPTDISVDGYPGKSITLHAPDIFPHDCDLDRWAYFASEDDSPDRYLDRDGEPSMQGQTDELWIVDVGGAVVVLDIAYSASSSQADLDDLRAILTSSRFE